MIGPPTCTNCGETTEFQTRISLPRQMIFRCPSCKAFRYMAAESFSPVQGQQQQQIQPDEPAPAPPARLKDRKDDSETD